MSKIFTWTLMFGNLITCKICIATINQNTWLNRALISHPLILSVEENEAQMGKIKEWTDGFFSHICESEDPYLLINESTQWSVTFAYTRAYVYDRIYHSYLHSKCTFVLAVISSIFLRPSSGIHVLSLNTIHYCPFTAPAPLPASSRGRAVASWGVWEI